MCLCFYVFNSPLHAFFTSAKTLRPLILCGYFFIFLPQRTREAENV